ncbi:HipA [mine drainage metagenome]|uniref:HipA n=1 Tax=mine drainage metagenome TaxID=410659 RepID=T1B187_9ZZZZ
MGDNRHYAIGSITTRHLIQSAEKAGLGRDTALSVINDLIEHGPAAVESVRQNLPDGFPGAIADSITQGVLSRLKHLELTADA